MSDGPTIYATEPLQVYLDDAASKKPAPGGGSVSACVGALGAALVSMVCNLTQGREKFADVETEIVALVGQAEAARGRLEQLLQDDTTAYNGVIDAYKMPKDTDAEKAARKAAVQDGLIIAADVPLEICRVAVEVCRLCKVAAGSATRRRSPTPASAPSSARPPWWAPRSTSGSTSAPSRTRLHVAKAAAEIDEIQAEAAALRAEVLEITLAKL